MLGAPIKRISLPLRWIISIKCSEDIAERKGSPISESSYLNKYWTLELCDFGYKSADLSAKLLFISAQGPVIDKSQTSPGVLFHLHSVCTHKDYKTRRTVHLTVAGIGINLHHVGLIQAFGRVRDVGVEWEVGGRGGVSDSFTARNKTLHSLKRKRNTCMLWIGVSVHWHTYQMDGSQMSTGEHVWTPLVHWESKWQFSLVVWIRIVFAFYLLLLLLIFH